MPKGVYNRTPDRLRELTEQIAPHRPSAERMREVRAEHSRTITAARWPRKTMRVPSREELAWAAGVFCGEGYTMGKAAGKYRQICIGMSQATDTEGQAPELLVRFMYIFRAGTLNLQARAGQYNPRHKESWVLKIGRFEHVQAIIAMMWCWLTPEKRAQATVALLACHVGR